MMWLVAKDFPVVLVLSGAFVVALLSSSTSCGAPPPPSRAGAEIRLSEVEAYRHVGDELQATAEAKEATLSPDGSMAELDEGAVTLTGSDLRVGAPSVDLDLDESRAEGRDGVAVSGPGYSLRGNDFELDGGTATLTVTGDVRATEELAAAPSGGGGGEDEEAARGGEEGAEDSRAAEPVTIDADEVVLHRRTNKAVFSGNVVAVRGGFRLTSHTLTVTYGENQRVTHLLAEGDVRVTEEERVVTARRAEFDNVREVLTLIGDAVLTEGDNVIRGDRVIFTLGTDEVRVERVRARVRVEDAASAGDSER